MLSSCIIISITFGAIYALYQEPGPLYSVLFNAQYDQCEGPDASNYTRRCQFSEDTTGVGNPPSPSYNQLIQCNPDGTRSVNILTTLAWSTLPAGAYEQFEGLFLVTSGSLQGKYVYEKVIHLWLSYAKRFSSVLGYSYVPTKSAVILIGDRVDLPVLIAPNGAYDAFSKACNTKCQGNGYHVA